ncbi:nucleoside triphosphate pyrophosphohydrolase [Crassaminicella thermophila]|uniref:Nucleoside triphosphate pyrophosphohydrolase n=1 Tax=Crassaminicella thermophila TaxID=2599308 RepID=A0A5C0SAA4_CRATE|nr:nucleoside triphosphate pyrophosphohydrolase [Crassaminicella thermophila]QEK11081.1 nucleoside triphosphate pyrophosphohydrolase [Crassaminicella thermophila]
MLNTLTVIGLGPGSKEYLTIGAMEKMKKTKKIFLRTKKHPVVSYLKEQGICFESFDYVYEEKESFDQVYETIVDNLVSMLKDKEVVYAVPGSPFVAERTIQLLIEKSGNEGFSLEFISSVSFIEAMLHTLKKDPIKGLQIIDGLQLDQQVPDIKTDVIVTQVYNKFVASEMKLRLMEYYPDEHTIVVVRGAGIPDEEKVENIKLYELDHVEWLDYLTSIYIPRIDDNTVKFYNMNDLMEIMKKLRGKDGCPWDIKQTHKSLRPYLIEEAYEVLEAIDNEDMDLFEEELGDLLLQIVFHAVIASENGQFDMRDVITGICKKLIYRHPHVFKEEKVDSASKAVMSWEKMKRKEKKEDTYTDGLRRIPKHLPALMKSYKVQGKAADVGFDWDCVEDAIEKIKEELDELLEVYNTKDQDKITEELGDLIFAVVNVARFLNVEPEIALNKTVDKFINRFEFIEKTANKNGKKLEKMSLEEMDALWNMAKIHKN